MPVIEGDELKPCKELYAHRQGKYINVLTHCNHPKCYTGCFDGRGDCEDYVLADIISDDIREVASLVERRKIDAVTEGNR